MTTTASTTAATSHPRRPFVPGGFRARRTRRRKSHRHPRRASPPAAGPQSPRARCSRRRRTEGPPLAGRTIAGAELELVRGDITREETDAIVNAANTTLLGGGGVDGAIHRAGGPTILEECRQLGGCTTGDAKLTRGGRLRARCVIHAVGPVYRDGRHGEPELLARVYQRSLEVAVEHGLRSIAFPSISTGAYRFPVGEAAPIALGTAARFLVDHPGRLDRVRFVLFSDADLAVYETALRGLDADGLRPTPPRGTRDPRGNA